MMRAARLRVGVLIVGGSLGLTACSASPAPVPAPTPSSSAPPASSTATPAPAPTPTPTPTRYAMPLALVVNVTRAVSDVPVAAARKVVADGGSRWSDLDQGSGRMRVVRAAGSTPAKALAAVREDASVLALVPADAVDARVRVLTVGGRHPLRDPERYPIEVASGKKVGQITTLSAVGDIMLARRVGRAIADDPDRPFAPLAKRLAGADITVGNLESTLSTDGAPTQGGDSFGARPRVLQGLDRAGFDLVSLANNHVGDYRAAAMRQTFSRLRDADLPYVGAGRDLDEARRPVIIERAGVRVGFLGTESIGETPAATGSRPGTNRLNLPPRTGPLDTKALKRITGDITRLSKRVDTVVVIPHWGTQYTHRVEAGQRIAARAFAEAGADLVIGGHPHWVQGWESVGDTVVVYSLGNFVFDMDFQTKTREGVFVEIVLWDGRVKAVEPVAYVIDDDFSPRLARGGRAAGILDDVWSSSRGPFRRP